MSQAVLQPRAAQRLPQSRARRHARVYAGIGSRQTPPDILRLATEVAQRLRWRGYWLRSGAAAGADAAFEEGAGDAKEIWLPWRGFNGHASPHTPSTAAFELAAKWHPAWGRCSRAAQALHARNGHQILGATLDQPVDFVLCWTPGGTGAGGTGQALRIARHWGIPIFDMGAGAMAALRGVSEILPPSPAATCAGCD